MHADALAGGTRVLIHDDVLATGGTAKAKTDLVEQLGGQVVGCAFVVELAFLRAAGRWPATTCTRSCATTKREPGCYSSKRYMTPAGDSSRPASSRHRGSEHGGEHLRARRDQPQQLLDGRRLLHHAVRVVGRVAEQRVGQLALAAQHGLRARPSG